MAKKQIIGFKNKKTGEVKKYEERIALIKSRHTDGTPCDLHLMLDSETITLQGGEEFMTMWCPIEMMGNEGAG